MEIKVNGESQTLELESVNVNELLIKNDVKQPEMVSVQLNGIFVQREEFGSKEVKHGDEVDFLYFMGGGSK